MRDPPPSQNENTCLVDRGMWRDTRHEWCIPTLSVIEFYAPWYQLVSLPLPLPPCLCLPRSGEGCTPSPLLTLCFVHSRQDEASLYEADRPRPSRFPEEREYEAWSHATMTRGQLGTMLLPHPIPSLLVPPSLSKELFISLASRTHH